ncbi:MAG: hypothetical protein P4L84_37075 [Isosphaeraceae bacterium]|nr:hypothetical protein [Isosphaeraceae bacterium]
MSPAAHRRAHLHFDVLETRCLLALTLSEFPIPAPEYSVTGITAGPDGKIWFTETNWNLFVGKIGVIDPSTHAISEFSLPIHNAIAYGITAGPDGSLWFTEFVQGQNGYIGQIDPMRCRRQCHTRTGIAF